MKILSYKSNTSDAVGSYNVTGSDRSVLNKFLFLKRFTSYVLIPSMITSGQYQIRTPQGAIYDINIKAM